jgi:hypothetical protein
MRELDVAADRQRADVPRAPVGRLHQPGAAAGDDRIAVPTQTGAQLPDQRVVGMLASRARRTEHGHGSPNLSERVKATSELGGDIVDTLSIGGTHRR